MIKRFKTFLYEMALPLSLAKKMVKGWEPKEKYFEIFSYYDTGPRENKKPYRIYFPLEVKKGTLTDDSYKIMKKINKILLQANREGIFNDLFVVEDYIMGILRKADDEEKRRIFKVGKVLNNLRNKLLKEQPAHELIKKIDKVMHKFNHDKNRQMLKQNKFMVVISHHAYDVAGMSTNRSWTNCMDLTDGVNKHYVKPEIDKGVMIAYLIYSDDLNIENPKASLDIVPYFNVADNSKMILYPRKIVYGNAVPEFEKFVHEWCNEVNEIFLDGDTSGLYCIPEGIYDDSADTKRKIKILDADVKDFIKNVWKKKNHHLLLGLSSEFIRRASPFIKLCPKDFDKSLSKYYEKYPKEVEIVLNNFVSFKPKCAMSNKEFESFFLKYKNIIDPKIIKDYFYENNIVSIYLDNNTSINNFINFFDDIKDKNDKIDLIISIYNKDFNSFVNIFKKYPSIIAKSLFINEKSGLINHLDNKLLNYILIFSDYELNFIEHLLKMNYKFNVETIKNSIKIQNNNFKKVLECVSNFDELKFLILKLLKSEDFSKFDKKYDNVIKKAIENRMVNIDYVKEKIYLVDDNIILNSERKSRLLLYYVYKYDNKRFEKLVKMFIKISKIDNLKRIFFNLKEKFDKDIIFILLKYKKENVLTAEEIIENKSTKEIIEYNMELFKYNVNDALELALKLYYHALVKDDKLFRKIKETIFKNKNTIKKYIMYIFDEFDGNICLSIFNHLNKNELKSFIDYIEEKNHVVPKSYFYFFVRIVTNKNMRKEYLPILFNYLKNMLRKNNVYVIINTINKNPNLKNSFTTHEIEKMLK